MDIYDELIEKCQEHIKANDVAAAKKFIGETCGIISGYVPNVKDGLNMYRPLVFCDTTSNPYTDEEVMADLKTLLGKLRVYRDERQRELELAKLKAAEKGAHVQVSAVSASTANVNISIDIALSQAYEELEKCELSNGDIEKIKAAMADVVAARSESNEAVLDRLSKLLDFTSKGVGVAQAILLFIRLFMNAAG